MQQIQFIREGMSNYMVIPCVRHLNRNSYGDVVLECAEVPGFLNYEIREMDGEQILYYTLKYRTPLRQVLGDLSLTFDKVNNMIASVIDALEQVEAYLLNPEYIMWNSECTFVEIHTGKLVFTYHPGYENKTGSLKSFLMECMQYIDKKDQKTYLFVMEFYHLVTNPDCTAEQLAKYMEQNTKGEKEQDTYLSSDIYEKEIYVDQSLSKEKGKSTPKRSGLPVIILIAVNLMVVCFLLFDILTYQYIWVLIVTVILLMLAFIQRFRTEDEDNPDTIMEEYWREHRENNKSEYYHMSVQTAEEPETTVLTKDNGIQDIVVEDEPKEFYLKSMKPVEYEDLLLTQKSVLIGSMAEGCDCVLKQKGISRMHAKVIKKEDGLYLLDLNSTNGTYLNEECIEPGEEYILQEGDMIAFAYVAVFVVERR